MSYTGLIKIMFKLMDYVFKFLSVNMILTNSVYMELLVKPEILTTYIYGPTFGNDVSRLFLCVAQRFNIKSMKKVILWHSCV
jgi:hypothetical protein